MASEFKWVSAFKEKPACLTSRFFIYEGIVFCMKKFLCPPHKRAVKRTAKAPETYATSILRGDFDMHLGRCLQCRGKFYFL